MSDTSTTISEVRLFLDKLRRDLPEIFSGPQAKQDKLPFPKKALYMGALRDVRVEEVPDVIGDVVVEGESFVVRIGDRKRVSPATCLDSWMRLSAEAIISTRTRELAAVMGVEVSRIAVKDQKSLWGSCSVKKNVNFSWRLIKAPPSVLDYLIVHELAHLVHMDHSDEFWAVVEKHCPDYKNQRKWLRQHRDELMKDIEDDSIETTVQTPDAPQPAPEAAAAPAEDSQD